MKTKKRIIEVDILKSIGILLIILIHTLSCHLNIKGFYYLWDKLHFVVLLFVFSSFYLLFKKKKRIDALPYYKKRIKRLIIPYYVFLAVLLILRLIFKDSITFSYVLQNLTLVRGVDINWFVLLFLELTLLTPLILLFLQKAPALTFCLTLLLILFLPQHLINYKVEMWIGWSLVITATYLIIKKPKLYKWSAFLSLLIYFVLQHLVYHNNSLFSHKYPPDLYYLSYGWGITYILYLAAIRVKKYLSRTPIETLIIYTSKNSYNLYFTHYLALYFLKKLGLYLNLYLHFSIVAIFAFSLVFIKELLLQRLILSHNTQHIT